MGTTKEGQPLCDAGLAFFCGVGIGESGCTAPAKVRLAGGHR